MQTALLGTAFLMGVGGGPHCVAMCGAACEGVVRVVRIVPSGGAALIAAAQPSVPIGLIISENIRRERWTTSIRPTIEP